MTVEVFAPTQNLLALREAERSPVLSWPPIAHLEALYLEWLRGSRSANTHTHYRTALGHFDTFLAAEGVDRFELDADALPLQVVELFVMWLRRLPRGQRGGALMPTSVAEYAAGVKGLFSFACRRHLVPPRFQYAELAANVADTLGKIPRRWATVDRRLPLLVAYVDNLPLPAPAQRGGVKRLELLRNRAMLHVMIGTGMRLDETIRLSRADVEDGFLGEVVIVGKGSKQRLVFLDDEALQAIRAYVTARGDEYAPLWLRHDNRRGLPGRAGECWRLGREAVGLMLKRYGRILGIDLHPHSLRHSFASALLNRGADITLIQELLGHSSPTVTKQVYAAFERETLRAALERYRPSVAEQAAKIEAEDARRRGAPIT